MKCPHCGGKSHVLYTQKLQKEVSRFRRCLECGYTFETTEKFVCVWVRKQNELDYRQHR